MYSVPILGTVLCLYAQMGQVVSLSPLCGRGGNMLSSPILFAFAALGTAPADPLRYGCRVTACVLSWVEILARFQSTARLPHEFHEV